MIFYQNFCNKINSSSQNVLSNLWYVRRIRQIQIFEICCARQHRQICHTTLTHTCSNELITLIFRTMKISITCATCWLSPKTLSSQMSKAAASVSVGRGGKRLQKIIADSPIERKTSQTPSRGRWITGGTGEEVLSCVPLHEDCCQELCRRLAMNKDILVEFLLNL